MAKMNARYQVSRLREQLRAARSRRKQRRANSPRKKPNYWAWGALLAGVYALYHFRGQIMAYFFKKAVGGLGNS